MPSGRWYFDKARLRQILFNLLNNAVKFVSEASLRCISEKSKEETYLSIRVRDTGIGIFQRSLKRIFQPLNKQSRQQGVLQVSLGLLIK
ncbi:ATP-binding protein [Vibrio lentus]|nr:ATP-binding protein [Vibrio lentus]